ncbi:MAG: TetR/AcrR family transcriptional regulator, partial [Spirochaetes bacterium]
MAYYAGNYTGETPTTLRKEESNAAPHPTSITDTHTPFFRENNMLFRSPFHEKSSAPRPETNMSLRRDTILVAFDREFGPGKHLPGANPETGEPAVSDPCRRKGTNDHGLTGDTMTKPARAAAEIEKVRESIIESAVGLIAAGGFAGMTMRRLAVKMEMSATNLYNYFRSKDEIYITILIRGFRDLYDRLHRARDRARDPVEQAKAVVSEYLSFGIDNFNYYDIMFSPSLPKYNDYMGTPYEA